MSGARFDWQFVIVSLAALWGAWAILRPLLRSRAARRAESAACAHCSAGHACAAPKVAANDSLVTLGAGRIGGGAGTAKPPA